MLRKYNTLFYTNMFVEIKLSSNGRPMSGKIENVSFKMVP